MDIFEEQDQNDFYKSRIQRILPVLLNLHQKHDFKMKKLLVDSIEEFCQQYELIYQPWYT